MASFDAQAILDAVDAGIAPDAWKIYRTRESNFLEQGTILWLAALAMLIAFALIAVPAILSPSLSWKDPSRYVVLFEGIALGIFSVVLFQQGFALLRQKRSSSNQLVVLTSDGLVVRTGPSQWLPAYTDAGISPTLQWAGTRGGRIYSVSYDQAISVDLDVGNSLFQAQITLIMTFINPRRLVFWTVPSRFPYRDTIAQNIIEAHARCAAQQAEAR